ncbi:hypothetical protein CEXT_774631 [Caerostris extrusa]|uniref:Uncharacterized protein n=1 Tax=Caerostris extrusa TaxID=172846 RepID=A0AAV4VHN2_CAEEX|nr:hypothetical protein CEXT_774631 [Caerostris extrusa]
MNLPGIEGKLKRHNPTKEGSVIALTIGMLILGFVLGGVTLNLVVSRKFGVSLFQRKQNRDPFSNSAGESSMAERKKRRRLTEQSHPGGPIPVTSASKQATCTYEIHSKIQTLQHPEKCS